jgi:hypothetical protein
MNEFPNKNESSSEIDGLGFTTSDPQAISEQQYTGTFFPCMHGLEIITIESGHWICLSDLKHKGRVLFNSEYLLNAIHSF